MKRLIKNLLLTLLLLFPLSVYASGGISVSPTSLTIEVGSSKSFTISAYNTIGDATITSSNSGVATVNSISWGTGMVDEGQTKTATITVTGVSEGSATITLTLDGATFDGEDLTGQKRTVSVTVIPKPSTPSNPTPPVVPNNTGTTSNTNASKSRNTNLKEVTVTGYELVKVDNNNYSLTVNHDVTSINISATPEDAKAKISGVGEHQLQVGENTIELIVTAEAGNKNTAFVKVTRKDNFYLEDLDAVLNSNTDDKNIVIKDSNVITSQNLEKIKNSKKTVKFNYINDEQMTLYSWIIDGSKLSATNELNMNIVFDSEHKKDIARLSNYADGIIINLKQAAKEGIKLKLYVGNKYENGDLVNIYYYRQSDGKLYPCETKIKVTDSYIDFDVSDSGDYLITMSNVNTGEVVASKTKSTEIYYILAGIIGLLLFLIVIILIVKRKKHKTKSVSV